MRVADAPSSTRLRTWVGRNGAGEVVRLRSQQQVPVARLGLQRRRLPTRHRQQRRHFPATQRRRVVVERDHGVVRCSLIGRLDEVEQAVGLGHAVDVNVGLEEPVARMLRVGLRYVKQLHSRGIPLDVIAEHVGVVFKVPVVKAQAQLVIDLLQRLAAVLHDGHRGDGARHHIRLERRQRLLVHLLGHAIVHQRSEGRDSLRRQRLGGLQAEPPGRLKASHLAQPTRRTDGHRVG
mmetsp:Transcript_1434/g.4269  ORF Transcript_1434/g.4269 Transcript_1434/m.4269 type:complete len:235 (+) Transcript_1434:2102-2806(+)